MTDATTYDFACGDLMDGCAATFHGSPDEVLSQVTVHAREAHGVDAVTQEMATAVQDGLRPVA